MTLPFDVTRCWDGDCPSAMTCARYRDRNQVGLRTPQVDTFREFDTDEGCEQFIKFQPTRTANVRGGE